MPNYPDNWNSIRQQVLERDQYQCQNCEFSSESGNRGLHVHHIVPLEQGGTNRMSNLKVLCSECHFATHGKGKAPTYSPESKHKTLDTFESKDVLKQYLTSKWGLEEMVEKILDRLDSDSPISIEELEHAESEAFQRWDAEQTTPSAVRWTPYWRREEIKKMERISAKEIENMRD